MLRFKIINQMKQNIFLLFLLIICFAVSAQAQTIPVDNVSNNLPCLEKNFNIRVVMTVDSTFRKPHLTDVQVDSLLEAASHYFSPICMSFTSCSYDVIPNYSYSKITRAARREEMAVVYHYPRRITLMVVQELDEGKCGYSKLDGLNTHNDAQIFVALDCDDGLAEQFAQHMGTLLGLLPTNYEVGTELVDGSNCQTAGDMICDTPADPFGLPIVDENAQRQIVPIDSLETYLHGCEFIWLGVDQNIEFYNPITTNMMSPYPCKCAFTREQFLKMLDNYDSTAYLKY